MQQLLDERLPDTQPTLIPVLRARVTARGASLDRLEDVRGRGMLSREYVITYRGHLQPNETLVAGRYPATGEVSVEESIAERFGVGVGDLVRFDVLGRAHRRAGLGHPQGQLAGQPQRRLHVRLRRGHV